MSQVSSSRVWALFEVILSAIAFGFLGIFGKLGFAAGLTAGEILALRFTCAGLTLCLGLFIFQPKALAIRWPKLMLCLALGVGGYSLFAGCYFAALEYLSASLTVLLQYTYPILVTIGAAVLFKEHLHFRQKLLIPIVFLGLGCLLWGDLRVDSAWGIALGLLSAVLYAGYILVSARYLKGVPPLTSTFYILVAAAFTVGVLHPSAFQKMAHASFSLWAIVLGIGCISTILPMILFLSGLQKLRSAEVSLISTLEPATAVAASVVLLHEPFTLLQTTGAVLVLGALILFARVHSDAPLTGGTPSFP